MSHARSDYTNSEKFQNWVTFGIFGIWELRAPPNNSKYVFQISDGRGPLPLPKTPSQRSGLRTPARPAVPKRGLLDWMALVASGIEVPQPRWSHLLSAIARGSCRIFYEFRKLRKSRISEFSEFWEFSECAGSVCRMHGEITRIPKNPKLGQFQNFRNLGAAGSPQ